jgi:hypothetical protein
MIKNKIDFNKNKRLIISPAAAATSILSVVTIVTLGSAQFSNQQQQEEEESNLTSSSDAQTSGDVGVKTNGLDISVGEGQGGGFELQVTERSYSMIFPKPTPGGPHTVSVQCNSDEIVTGGGYSASLEGPVSFEYAPVITKKQDNGWSATWVNQNDGIPAEVQVHAECLKVMNQGTTG